MGKSKVSLLCKGETARSLKIGKMNRIILESGVKAFDVRRVEAGHRGSSVCRNAVDTASGSDLGRSALLQYGHAVLQH